MQDRVTVQEHIISSFSAHRKPQFPRVTRAKTDSRDCTLAGQASGIHGSRVMPHSMVCSNQQHCFQNPNVEGGPGIGIGVSPTWISFKEGYNARPRCYLANYCYYAVDRLFQHEPVVITIDEISQYIWRNVFCDKN